MFYLASLQAEGDLLLPKLCEESEIKGHPKA